MKSSNVFITLFSFMLLMVAGCASPVTAQSGIKPDKKSDVTVSLKVYGVCGQCKERIESTALDVKGVKKAEWDNQSDVLVLTGNSRMDRQKVAQALSKAGHKSELSAADPKSYGNLPACCQYDSGAEKH